VPYGGRLPENGVSGNDESSDGPIHDGRIVTSGARGSEDSSHISRRRHPLENLSSPPTTPKTHQTPIDTGDLYFQNLA
jgi:hypothetical protein